MLPGVLMAACEEPISSGLVMETLCAVSYTSILRQDGEIVKQKAMSDVGQ